MAQPEYMTRAEGDFASTSAGTRPVIEESTTTMERSTLSSAKEEPSCSGAGASVGCASFIGVLLRRVFPCLRVSTHSSSSEYFSTRIQSIIDGKFETEIEASKVHWSELPPGSGAQGCAEADMELFRTLQQQYEIETPDGKMSFFEDWNEDLMELGEKIAEGGQGAIHHLRWLRPENAHMNGKVVVKVFKLEGCSLEALHQQWPPVMLHKIISDPSKRVYADYGISPLGSGVMLKDGRFGFLMARYWGDLRKMIDLRMVQNGFWRAREILLGLKNHQVEPSLFTAKSDVYSYGMTCYEILTGKIPFEDVPIWKYDEVIVHNRELLFPSDISRCIQSILKRCWHHDPSSRPSFEEILEKIEELEKNYMKKWMESFVDCFLR